MTSLAPILLQAAVTAGLLAVFGVLTARYRKGYLAWWTAAWFVFLVRLGAIAQFVASGDTPWLWLHQAATGWTAVALLGAAWSFSHRHLGRGAWVGLLLAPPIWASIAMLGRDQFTLVAGVTVVVLSAATALTGWAFFRYHRDSGSAAALAPAVTLFLWAIHHLDYPVLRAWDAWNPWGYYLDTLFEVALGAGVLFLVIEDIERGVRTLGALALGVDAPDGDDTAARLLDRIVTRILALPGVSGAALVRAEPDTAAASAGVLVSPLAAEVSTAIHAAAREARGEDRPTVRRRHGTSLAGAPFAYLVALPLGHVESELANVESELANVESELAVTPADVLIVVGHAREPFAALDVPYLRALGRQVGTILSKHALLTALSTRSDQLASLSALVVNQHEDERRRLARELHDETAQVFSAVRLQLGLLEDAPPDRVREILPRALELIDTGIASIRAVTDRLRPPLLDDLGLEAALRALYLDFEERTGIAVTTDFQADLTRALGSRADAELAVFRAVQEGLNNVSRHAEARTVCIRTEAQDGFFHVRVIDDGIGLTESPTSGRMGIVGMRERLHALGGQVTLGPADVSANGSSRGTELAIRLPLSSSEVQS